MADNLDPLLAFNGGEEIRSADFEDSSWMLRRQMVAALADWQIQQASVMESGDAGLYLPLGNYVGSGALASLSHVACPAPGEMFDSDALLTKSLYNWTGRLLKYRKDADGGALAPGRIHSIQFDEGLVQFTGLAFPAGLPAASPRWDSLEFDLVDSYGTTESRDTEDASTRALTTGTPSKRINTDFANVGWVSGAEAALPDFPALTDATRGRLLSIKRIVGEGGAVLRTAYALHVYPLRLAVEDVMAVDADFDTTYWTRGPYHGLTNTGASASSGNLHFVPRRMHAGCRLLAVAVCWNLAAEPEVALTRFTYGAPGGPSATTIADVGSGDVINHQVGIRYCGEAEWSANSGIASGSQCGYPLWGNGHTYGPLFHNEEAGDEYVSKLGVLISGASGGGQWASADVVNFVRFIYAY